MAFNLKGLFQILSWFLVLKLHDCLEEQDVCNRRPLNTKTAPLPPDNRFAIDIIGCDGEYIPERAYPIKLYARDNQSSFIAFTISATGDTKENEKNPHKPINLSPGRILSSSNSSIHDTVTKEMCNETVFEADVMPKTSVEAQWIAPPKGNRCVTIYAYVAVKPDVWYSSDGPLSKQVCEDHRKEEDMKPPENNECSVCEEARYELHFEGLWSYNTHPKMFPQTEDLAKLARFSDIVGASHGKNFILYKDNNDATPGLEMLAEHGNTTQIEQEILKELGTNVRTVIKASGPPKPSMSTVATFRASRYHHFISVVTAIIPSPDWFLGVYNFELCDNKTGTWMKYYRYNMYPLDAGTDSGASFESPNEKTSPQQAISEVPYEQKKPFAKLTLTLIRTYPTPYCDQYKPEQKTSSEENGDGENGGEDRNQETSSSAPVRPVTRPPPPVVDTGSTDDCPMTTWEEWLPCEGECIDNKVVGYHSRFRYPIIDGVAVGKDFEAEIDDSKEIPEACLIISTIETKKCEEECTEPTLGEEEAEVEAVQEEIGALSSPLRIFKIPQK